jgi:hypothetical protein
MQRSNGFLAVSCFSEKNTSHPRFISQRNWTIVEPRLDAVLKEFGPDNRAGRREGKGYLTLSQAGLVKQLQSLPDA